MRYAPVLIALLVTVIASAPPPDAAPVLTAMRHELDFDSDYGAPVSLVVPSLPSPPISAPPT